MCSLWFGPTHLAAAGTSAHETRANHVLCEEMGVGVLADPVIDDGLLQALQPVRIVVCGAGRQVYVTVPKLSSKNARWLLVDFFFQCDNLLLFSVFICVN